MKLCPLGEKGHYNTPCLEGRACIDGDAECVAGQCRCQSDFYFKDGTCGQYSQGQNIPEGLVGGIFPEEVLGSE